MIHREFPETVQFNLSYKKFMTLECFLSISLTITRTTSLNFPKLSVVSPLKYFNHKLIMM